MSITLFLMTYPNDSYWNKRSSGHCFVDLVAEHGKDDLPVLHFFMYLSCIGCPYAPYASCYPLIIHIRF